MNRYPRSDSGLKTTSAIGSVSSASPSTTISHETTGKRLVQLFGAMVAVALDSLSFLLSAIFLAGIKRREPTPSPESQRQSAIEEIREGLGAVWITPVLRTLAGTAIAEGLAFGLIGPLMVITGIMSSQAKEDFPRSGAPSPRPANEYRSRFNRLKPR